ncbi:MAG TPA: CAP domain-containing protein [Pirellulaceae bacterium]|nr:CAP domain-containing protein [Pirellulaceae bacterium]
MRIVCFAVMALTCSVALAEMPQDQGQQQTSGPEAKQEQKETQNEAKEEVHQAAAQVEIPVEKPLHRHPTLLSMLRRNNEIRRRLGLTPHRINPALTQAAQDHANYMARTGDFQHYSNGGPQYRAGRYGFRGFVRENIAYNYRSVEDAFSVWQGSSGHYASIVSGTDEAGFGYAIGPGGAIYYVGVYGTAPTAEERGEDEATAFKLAAEAKGETAGDAAASPETTVDPLVVPAAAAEPVPAEQPAAAAAEQPQTQQVVPTYNNSNRRRGLFGRRR